MLNLLYIYLAGVVSLFILYGIISGLLGKSSEEIDDEEVILHILTWPISLAYGLVIITVSFVYFFVHWIYTIPYKVGLLVRKVFVKR